MMHAEKATWKESLEAYLYLAPAAVILGIFWFVPVVVSFVMSFGNVTALMPLTDMKYVGLRQYQAALLDSTFQQSLWNTLNYAIYSVPAKLALGLIAALLLNARVAGRGFFRVAFFLPYVTTWVAISIVFKYLFDREFGLGNWLLKVLSVDLLGHATPWRLEWLNEARGIWELLFGFTAPTLPFGIQNLVEGPSLSLFCVILTSVWRDTGYFCIIFLAGLQNIDRSLYEAASIDGAGGWSRFRAITFPLLSPVTFFLLIISVIGAFKIFVPQYMMTPTGGPDNTTMPIVMYLYEEGFTGTWKLSYASAIAYLLTLIILALTVLQNRLIGRRVEYGH